jgi:hypothetical protein
LTTTTLIDSVGDSALTVGLAVPLGLSMLGWIVLGSFFCYGRKRKGMVWQGKRDSEDFELDDQGNQVSLGMVVSE